MRCDRLTPLLFDDRLCPTYEIGPVCAFYLRFRRNDFRNHSVAEGGQDFLTVFDVAHNLTEVMLELSNVGFHHV